MKFLKLILFYILKMFGKRIYPENTLIQNNDSKYYYILFEYIDGRVSLLDEFDCLTLIKLEDLKSNYKDVEFVMLEDRSYIVEEINSGIILTGIDGERTVSLSELNEGAI